LTVCYPIFKINEISFHKVLSALSLSDHYWLNTCKTEGLRLQSRVLPEVINVSLKGEKTV